MTAKNPALTTALVGLTTTQATWKRARERHSIWHILRHMTHPRHLLSGTDPLLPRASGRLKDSNFALSWSQIFIPQIGPWRDLQVVASDEDLTLLTRRGLTARR